MPASEYTPFGPEWEAEVMKSRKDQLVAMLRAALRREKSYASQLQTLADTIIGGENVPAPFPEVKERLGDIIRDRCAMRDWIMQAAPMLSAAAGIVIDEAVERLGEIEGCRAVLELCPVNFENKEGA